MKALLAGVALVLVLAVVSLFTGVSDVTPASLLNPDSRARALGVLLESRVPRTLALVLAGMSMAVAGMIMQMLARNRFVEPSTAGVVESASLGMLTVMLLAPGLPVFARMLVATGFALAGTALFLWVLRRVPLRSPLLAPLVGIMLGGVISAFTVFLAYRYDLTQSLGAWTMGDFSAVLSGRYELLWISGALTLLAFRAADRFTVIGLGEGLSTTLGLSYTRVFAQGMVIVATVTATVVVTVGSIPFLGLVAPNIVSLAIGDNLRRTVPYVALLGAALVLGCDILGRVVVAPYEIPIGPMMGVFGAAVFLALLLRRPAARA
ncbi:iron chelate uptake ABC transporter family permease subunit [Paroceanicella profunda]|uniref:Iron chelate uptake ABC transporter family permease subunit n=1 Tax=Paroceanicella profunda TaxID=2579971 RepID=A0A5B8FGF3_9RHOB|nr:iron chelate uptake ABC transporter family permease subunit [Paroceanicella profunda]QDL91141.1 iron chelate uptake ABC transporter family permease subunit [Paroceanicella profunda]